VEASFSPSVLSLPRTLTDEAVSTSRLVDQLLADHSSYARGAVEPDWPPRQRETPIGEWLAAIAGLYREGETVHGRHAILGAALLDATSGRRMVEAGLAHAIGRQLTGWLPALSAQGRDRLTAIPALASDAGLPPPTIPVPGRITALVFDDEGGQLAVGTDDGSVLVVDRVLRTLARFRGNGAVTALAWGPGGGFVYAGHERGTVMRWSLADPDAVPAVLNVGADAREIVARIPDGPVMVLAGEDLVRTTATLEDVIERKGDVTSLHSGKQGDIVVCTRDGAVELRDIVSGQTLRTMGAGTEPAREALPLEGGAVAATIGSNRVVVWNAQGSPILDRSADGEVVGIATLPAHEAVAISTTTSVDLVGFGATNLPDIAAAGPVAAGLDGKRLATGDGTSVAVWMTATGALLAELTLERPAGARVFSRDAAQLATAIDGGLQLWDISLIRRRAHLLTEYAADVVKEDADLLGIDRDVDAFAALVAARTVTPPLSIALFGEWGSGKSFFMRRMRRMVDQLSRESRESGLPQDELTFHKRIAQVEFNAWHYVDGNLWASLVDHLLANLRIAPDEEPDAVERRKQRVLEELVPLHKAATEAKTAQKQAEGARDEAAEKAREASEREQELARQIEAIANAPPQAELTPAVHATVTSALEAVGAGSVGEAAEDVIDAVSSARAMVERAGVTAVASAPDARRRWRQLIGGIVLGPLLGLAIGTLLIVVGSDAIGVLTGIATAVASALGATAAWIRKQVAWRTEQMDRLDAAREAAIAPLRRAQKEQERERMALEKQRVAAETEREAEQEREAAERERIAALEAQAEAITPAGLLAELIQNRIASEDYRRQLGTVALVRQDFDDISNLLQLQAEWVEAGDRRADEDLGIGRIVLYIDDLDRCPPRKVIQVLEAIHLLLAFPLFVVVVGVDARWLSRSLAMRHPRLLTLDEAVTGPDGSATPRDYLEKIFQIPFWLQPLDADATRLMLRGLLPDAARLPAAGGPSPQPATQSAAEPTRDPGAASEVVGAAAESAAAATPAPPAHDLNPESLEMSSHELEMMELLAPLLGRSPRALKRFVNTYRLIKARQIDPVGFSVSGRHPVRFDDAVMVLLAVSTGSPRLAPRLLNTLSGPPTRGVRLVDLLTTMAADRDDADLAGEASAVVRWLQEDASDRWREVDAGALRRWAEEVARFGFRLDALRSAVPELADPPPGSSGDAVAPQAPAQA
jgi:hypothetical protein